MGTRFVLLLVLFVSLSICIQGLPKVVYYNESYDYKQNLFVDESIQIPRDCSLDVEECFSLDRCAGRPFTVFSYVSVETLYRSGNTTTWKLLVEILTPYFVFSSPETACLILPPFDVSRLFFQGFPTATIASKCPAWDFGRHHIFVGFEDPDISYILEPQSHEQYIGRSLVLLSSGLTNYRTRLRFDLTLPLIHEKSPEWFLDQLSKQFVQDTLPPEKRKWLYSFKGTRYPYMGTIRNKLVFDNAHHTADDIIILTECVHPTKLISSHDWRYQTTTNCSQSQETFDREPYDHLLKESVFSLCPRGVGRHSFRLLEAMVFGSIPVILSDGYALPFAPELDLSECTIVWPEAQHHRLQAFLRQQTSSERNKRWLACRRLVWIMFGLGSNQFAKTDPEGPQRAILKTSFEFLKRRLNVLE